MAEIFTKRVFRCAADSNEGPDVKSQPDFKSEARALGYAPFIMLSPLEYLTLREIHGDWIFTELFPKLQDPARIQADWAVCFAAVAAALPRAEVFGTPDAYGRIIRDPTFMHRREHIRAFRRVFFGVVWRRMQAGAVDLPAAERPFYLADHQRWRVKLGRPESAGRPGPISWKTERQKPKTKSPVIEVKRRSIGDVSAESHDQPHPKKIPRGVWINPRPGEPIVVRKLS